MEVTIFDNYHDFYRFIQWYKGELILKPHFLVYDNNVLVAQLIKNKQ